MISQWATLPCRLRKIRLSHYSQMNTHQLSWMRSIQLTRRYRLSAEQASRLHQLVAMVRGNANSTTLKMNLKKRHLLWRTEALMMILTTLNHLWRLYSTVLPMAAGTKSCLQELLSRQVECVRAQSEQEIAWTCTQQHPKALKNDSKRRTNKIRISYSAGSRRISTWRSEIRWWRQKS